MNCKSWRVYRGSFLCQKSKMVPVFLCLENVFDLMWWSFIVYYKWRTCSSGNLRKRDLVVAKPRSSLHKEKCDFNKPVFNKILYLVVFSCINLPPHVHLVCDIYCAHAYLCRCDSKVFRLRKLKSKRLIFLINFRSNLTINIVSRAKKMRKEWLTKPTLTKKDVFFIPTFHLASSLLLK